MAGASNPEFRGRDLLSSSETVAQSLLLTVALPLDFDHVGAAADLGGARGSSLPEAWRRES
jgi:hypothetical protein